MNPEKFLRRVNNFMEIAIQKKYFFILFAILVCILSLPSIIRLYYLRSLFFYASIRQGAFLAIETLRDEAGIGATDLSLLKIEKQTDEIDYIFRFQYKHPDKIFAEKNRGMFLVGIKSSSPPSVLKIDL